MSARRRARRSGVQAVRDRDIDDGRIGEIAVAVLQGELGRFHGEVHVIGVGERRDVEALEQGEDR